VPVCRRTYIGGGTRLAGHPSQQMNRVVTVRRGTAGKMPASEGKPVVSVQYPPELAVVRQGDV